MNLLDIPYEKYKLLNGLEIILFQNNSLPSAAVNIWYKAGSANEITGKTGLAHLFEHMMFQGSKNVPKEMHFKYIQEAGGTLNASTSFDRTNYFEKLPSNDLELALWLESDRMAFFLEALDQVKLDNQKSVVLNERLERYDNQPYGLAWEKIISNLYPDGHPYSWATIGYYKDIESYTLDDVSSFFQQHYSPSNATIVVAGNFEINKTKSLIEKYFGEIKNNGTPTSINSKSSHLEDSKFITVEDKVNLERIYIAWHTQTAFSQDDAALDILSDLLTGSKNARLTRKLVYELEIAQDVNTMQFSGKYGGHFMIVATAKPGKSLDEIKKIIFDEISILTKEKISLRELKRSKNVIKSNFIYSLQNIDTIADMLNLYNYYLGEPNSFNFDLNRYNNVYENDISQVVNEYFQKNYVELRIVPERKNAN
ncbi:MAG TPA: pitrilysin family protein [Ignavibacteriaceae bacterium]|nr:pitrilysin family protein [Ignavibacteriaceae bacterium]